MARVREAWATRIGLILAVAGNAVGLGNFLRFPVQAASNGGGAFMIPYFISFILLGIPLMWMEWTIGRYGGRYGHHSAPGMFAVIWRHPIAKYLGALGLFISLTIMVYYTYIESWTLGYSIFSLLGSYFNNTTFESAKEFLLSYQGLKPDGPFTSVLTAYGFLLITLAINFYVLSKGISGGIEKLARIAMPTLFVFAFLLAIRVLTFEADPAIHKATVWEGLGFLWNPDLSALSDPKVWLAAAGQIFFTLSLGMGTIHAYASYLRPKDDIALSGLTTASINEFAEVVLGSSIAIPIAVVFFGVQATQEIAQGGAFNLGFVSMSVIFSQIPFGEFFGFLWFGLLFFAGITSSVAMAQPVISFMEDEFRFSRNKAVAIIAVLTFLCIQPVVFLLGHGFLDELDYWGGTFMLVVFALIETVLFAFVLGVDKGYEELMRGADIRIPAWFKWVFKFITPLFLIAILGYWAATDAWRVLLLEGVSPEDIPHRWAARGLMVAFSIGICWMVYRAWQYRKQMGLRDDVIEVPIE